MDDSASQFIINRPLVSFVEILDLVQGWTADFRQLDREQFQSDVIQAQIGDMLVTGGHFGCTVNQKGSQPRGMRSFAIQDAGCPDMLWYKHVVTPDALLSFPTHGEVDVVSRPGFSVLTFSVLESLLQDYVEKNQLPSLDSALGSGEKMLPASPEQLKAFRFLCIVVRELAATPVSNIGTNSRQNDIQERFLELLASIIYSGYSGPTLSVNWKYRKLGQLLDILNAPVEGEMRMSDIYALSGLPARTAQHLFRQEFGITPKAYLMGQRLYAAHRALWHADVHQTNVSDIANEYGFWHMGQFAKIYRSIYGVTPRETLAVSLR